MAARPLIELDMKIASLRQRIANGSACGETEQVKLAELLQQRDQLVETMAEEPRKDIPGR